jgi:hypothetical protein
MKPRTNLLAKAFIVALPLCAVAKIAAAQEQMVEPPPPAPPPTYVATVAPVYYNGVPMYWYLNHWYWLAPGGAWSYYRVEPRFLHDERMRGRPFRHFEEHRFGGGHFGGHHR